MSLSWDDLAGEQRREAPADTLVKWQRRPALSLEQRERISVLTLLGALLKNDNFEDSRFGFFGMEIAVGQRVLTEVGNHTPQSELPVHNIFRFALSALAPWIRNLTS